MVVPNVAIELRVFVVLVHDLANVSVAQLRWPKAGVCCCDGLARIVCQHRFLATQLDHPTTAEREGHLPAVRGLSPSTLGRQWTAQLARVGSEIHSDAGSPSAGQIRRSLITEDQIEAEVASISGPANRE